MPIKSRAILPRTILFNTGLITALSLSSVQPTYADTGDAGMAVYGIVLATLGAGIGGNLYGEPITKVMTSGTQKHQVSLLAGTDNNIDTGRLAYRWDFVLPSWTTEYFVLSNSLELSYGHWQAPNHYRHNQVDDLGVTPIFKFKQEARSPWYAEVAIGAHYLSQVKIKDYSKSTQFQFGDQFGIGWENDHIRLGYRYLHVSNGNIEIPNPATDFQLLDIGYRY